MAEGSSSYRVVLQAVIKKITQAQVDVAASGVKGINVSLNISGLSAKQEIEKVRQQFAKLGDSVSIKKVFDEDGMRQYNVGVEKVASGMKTIDTYTVDINKNGEESVKLTNSINNATSKLSGIEKQQIETYNAKGKAQQAALSKLEAEKVAHKNIGEILSNNAKKVAEWAISTALIYGSLNEIRQAMQYIVDLNKQMTGIRMVTGMSSEDVNKLAGEYNNLAKELGATTLEISKGSLEWFRQSKTVAEVNELMQSTMMLSKLGNIESAQATEYLTSTLNGFSLEAKDAVSIVDKLVN